MARIDLHSHSNRSDGVHDPQWVVRRAARNGAQLFALTDHDTLDGVADALDAAQALNLTLIPGIELGAHHDPIGEVHVLAHFPSAGSAQDPALHNLQTTLARYRQQRIDRARETLDRLRQLGIELDFDRVADIARHDRRTAVGRPHIARAMVEAGHADSVQDAFNRFLANHQSAYVPRQLLTVRESIDLIHDAHGLATLAHPNRYDQPDIAVHDFANYGGDGLEVYYRVDPPDLIALAESWARDYDLLPTVGSDWHGLSNRETEPATVDAPDHIVEQLLSRYAPPQTANVGAAP